MNNVLKPFFENKNRGFQIVTLAFLLVLGMLVFSALGTLVAAAVYGQFGMTGLDIKQQAGFLRIVQSFSSVGTFMLPALAFSWCAKRSVYSYNKLDKLPDYRLTDIVLVMSLVILPLVMGLSEWNDSVHLPGFMQRFDAWMRKLDENNADLLKLMVQDRSIGILLINVFVMAVLPALGEELFFRGTIQTFLQGWTRSPNWAIWITAFIFSAIHFQITGFIPRMLLGAYLGYLFYWSGSLWLPILAHFMHNGLSILSDYIFTLRGYDVNSLNFSDLHNYEIIFIVSVILAIGGVMLLRKNRMTKN